MNTLNVTCPADGEQFIVVEPDDHTNVDSLTATCPRCNERFAIVYPDELRDSQPDRPTYEPYSAGLVEWEQREDPPAPYTGSDEAIPFEQYIIAKIDGLGGGPSSLDEDSQTYEESLKPDRFQIWYTPDHDEIAYVVRADLETGVKTKNVYSHEGGLFVKNRGVPRDSDKQWTYLDRDECYARASQAGLDGEITEHHDQEGRYNIFLNHEEQPLINKDSELAEELVLELARMLVAFQTKRI